MSTKTVTNFIGIPVEIDQLDQNRSGSVEQWGAEKLRELMMPLLEAGVIVRWNQYTPYFNDGDICEFSVSEPRFKISDEEDDESGDYGDGFLDTYDVQIDGGEEITYERQQNDPSNRTYPRVHYVEIKTGRVFDRHPAYEDMNVFSSALGRGHFEELLYETFGDHAEVTVSIDGIVKEYYSHD